METIELGLVVIDQQERRVVDMFQSFVRPRLHPQLTPFCKHLTTIEQSDIDTAPDFAEAMQRLNDFASGYTGAAWLSWGKYDATQIRRRNNQSGQ
ncbi:sporulation inhibitor KapD [compost metagenome]